jgi:hemerythrin
LSDVMGWNNSFEVNIESLDTQHKRLLGMFNALGDAVARHEAQPVLMMLFDGLVQYTKAHFAAEERLLEKHNFPGLAEHRAGHEALAARIREFRKQFETGNRDIGPAMLDFLREWLSGHIMKTDKEYSAFLRARGEK